MLTLNFNSAVHKSWIFFSKPLACILEDAACSVRLLYPFEKEYFTLN